MAILSSGAPELIAKYDVALNSKRSARDRIPPSAHTNGSHYLMQTHYSRTRERARDFQPKHSKSTVTHIKPTAPPPTTASPPSATRPPASWSCFSPLIEEFLDDCDYSDR